MEFLRGKRDATHCSAENDNHIRPRVKRHGANRDIRAHKLEEKYVKKYDKLIEVNAILENLIKKDKESGGFVPASDSALDMDIFNAWSMRNARLNNIFDKRNSRIAMHTAKAEKRSHTYRNGWENKSTSAIDENNFSVPAFCPVSTSHVKGGSNNEEEKQTVQK